MKNYLSRINEISHIIQSKLGFGVSELIALFLAGTLVLVLIVIFIFWGFQQFTKQSIGLTLLHTVEFSTNFPIIFIIIFSLFFNFFLSFLYILEISKEFS